ncbi:MAG: hypothetical protein BroJett014_31130 [Planctomycetota bacterium]|nr:MAG: hypothetical protein BroJett014_31130 [Planctomycetota bacterium]
MGSHEIPFALSGHALERMTQRGISGWVIRIVLEFGEWLDAGEGCHVLYLGRRALRWARAVLGKHAEMVANVAVILADDGTVVTAYRTPRPLRHWRGDR